MCTIPSRSLNSISCIVQDLQFPPSFSSSTSKKVRVNFLPKPETRRNEKASIARKKLQNINIHHQDENDEENMNAFLKKYEKKFSSS